MTWLELFVFVAVAWFFGFSFGKRDYWFSAMFAAVFALGFVGACINGSVIT